MKMVSRSISDTIVMMNRTYMSTCSDSELCRYALFLRFHKSRCLLIWRMSLTDFPFSQILCTFTTTFLTPCIWNWESDDSSIFQGRHNFFFVILRDLVLMLSGSPLLISIQSKSCHEKTYSYVGVICLSEHAIVQSFARSLCWDDICADCSHPRWSPS